jgi:hypothetical protein
MSEIRAPVGGQSPQHFATDLLVHTLAHVPNLEGARRVAERCTFANVRRT